VSAGRIERLAERVLAGDRRALAQAITLVESTRADHRDEAEALMAALLPKSGGAQRLGITGVPGVGKSTFIEAFGLHLIAAGHRVAVLAVDPSSQRSGGSILGDKTRMQELARAEAAFIRPSPAGRSLGGVARRTREALLVCEAAGFDVVIVETVGVGQAETAVSDLVDMFILLLLPGSGDDLQGIKRGVTELVDLVLINKADGDLAKAARHTAADYLGALQLMQPRTRGWSVPVVTCSALENRGIDEAWSAVKRYRTLVEDTGSLGTRRARQSRSWFWDEVSASSLQRLKQHPRLGARLLEMETQVVDHRLPPTVAAQEIVNMFFGEGQL